MGALPPILLVDDDPDDLFILKRLLLKAGVKNKVVAMEDVRTALVYLENEIQSADLCYVPCVVFTDLNMPQLSGIEFVRWMRGKAQLDKTKIVMVSSSEDPLDAAQAEKEGATHFFLKYPAPSVLASVVADTEDRKG